MVLLASIIASVAMTLPAEKALCQEQPVKWTFSTTQIRGGLYELRITIVIDSGWHLYEVGEPPESLSSLQVVFDPHEHAVVNKSIKAYREYIRPERPGQPRHERKIDLVHLVKVDEDVPVTITGHASFIPCRYNRPCESRQNVDFSIDISRARELVPNQPKLKQNQL